MAQALTFHEQAIYHHRRLFNKTRNAFLAETLIFAHLKRDPVLRAPEGSPVDGAIYLPFVNGWSLIDTWYARNSTAQASSQTRCCVYFDIKNRALAARRPETKTEAGLCWSRAKLTQT